MRARGIISSAFADWSFVCICGGIGLDQRAVIRLSIMESMDLHSSAEEARMSERTVVMGAALREFSLQVRDTADELVAAGEGSY